MMDRPRIVCLCGSTRFWDTFQEANYEETMAGRIVLSVACRTSEGDDKDLKCLHPEEYRLAKARLDALHCAKIDLSDEILVLDVGGYIGESTCREIEYALMRQKRIRYWSAEHGLDPVVRFDADV